MKRLSRILSIVMALLLVVSFVPGIGLTARADASGDVSGSASQKTWELKFIDSNNNEASTLNTPSLSLENKMTDSFTVGVKKNGNLITPQSEGYPTITHTVDPESIIELSSENSSNGVKYTVTPKNYGSATVTFTLADDPDTKITYTVTVQEKKADGGDATSITVAPKGKDTLWVGGSAENLTDLFNVTTEPANATTDLEWTVDNKKVADIEGGTKLAPKGRGAAKVTVTDKNTKKSASTTVYVDQFYCDSTTPKSAKWRQTSKVTLDFHVKCDYDDKNTYSNFDCIYVDSKLVDPKNYETAPGSIVIKLKPEYLSTLSLGKHELEVVFKVDGDTLATEKIPFRIVDSSSSVDTKDATLIGLGVFLFLLSLTYVALFTYDKKTRRLRMRRRAVARRRYY